MDYLAVFRFLASSSWGTRLWVSIPYCSARGLITSISKKLQLLGLQAAIPFNIFADWSKRLLNSKRILSITSKYNFLKVLSRLASLLNHKNQYLIIQFHQPVLLVLLIFAFHVYILQYLVFATSVTPFQIWLENGYLNDTLQMFFLTDSTKSR